jgi:hypothetical protein
MRFDIYDTLLRVVVILLTDGLFAFLTLVHTVRIELGTTLNTGLIVSVLI